MMYANIIELGILFLLVYTPLAFGGVTEYSLVIMKTTTGGLLLTWLAWRFSQRKYISSGMSRKRGDAAPGIRRYYLPVTMPPGFIALCLFFGFMGFQLIPLPASVMNILSPQTYRLHAETADHLGQSMPSFTSLSVCPQTTESELTTFLSYAIVYVLIITTIKTHRQIRRIVYTILTVGFFEASFGLLQSFSAKPLISLYDPSVWVRGSFILKNHFAGYLGMIILLTFGVLFARFEEKRLSSSKTLETPPEEHHAKILFLLAALCIMICAQVLSGSRGGIVSCSLGLFFFVTLVSLRRLLRRRIMVLVFFLIVVVLLVIVLIPEQLFLSLNRFTGYQFESSFRVRWEVWKTQWYIFRDFPLLGSGFGTFSHLAQRYQRFHSPTQLVYSESDVMQLLSETGILGVLSIVLALSLFFYRTLSFWKKRHSRWVVAIVAGGLSALVSLLIHSGVEFNFRIPSNALLFSVIAALSYVTTQAHKKQQHVNIHHFSLHPGVFFGFVGVFAISTGLFLTHSIRTFLGFTAHQRFKKTVLAADQTPGKTDDYQTIIDAINHDKNHPEYSFTRGKYLLEQAAASQNSVTSERIEDTFDEALRWLQQAVWLDPANPDYYYELGRLGYYRGDCSVQQNMSLPKTFRACSTARYFTAALQNAPKSMFLRSQVGQWFLYYNSEAMLTLMREMIAGDEGNFMHNPGKTTNEFSRILYDLQMDYESDLVRTRMKRTELSECKESIAPVSNTSGIELRYDDGTSEWKTRLGSETQRVKKVFCLPDSMEEYTYAALKIMMNRGRKTNVSMQISLDDHPITPHYDHISPVPGWHEIPFDKTLLEGKSSVFVYIRSSGNDYVQIWGDQDTPNEYSTFHLHRTKDLSDDGGQQKGEYMIRLILRP